MKTIEFDRYMEDIRARKRRLLANAEARAKAAGVDPILSNY